jgi:hypothetical protein
MSFLHSDHEAIKCTLSERHLGLSTGKIIAMPRALAMRCQGGSLDKSLALALFPCSATIPPRQETNAEEH